MEMLLTGLITGIVVAVFIEYRFNAITKTLVAVGSDMVKLMTVLIDKGVIRVQDLDNITIEQAEKLFEKRGKNADRKR
jgi:hypothetical protein